MEGRGGWQNGGWWGGEPPSTVYIDFLGGLLLTQLEKKAQRKKRKVSNETARQIFYQKNYFQFRKLVFIHQEDTSHFRYNAAKTNMSSLCEVHLTSGTNTHNSMTI